MENLPYRQFCAHPESLVKFGCLACLTWQFFQTHSHSKNRGAVSLASVQESVEHFGQAYIYIWNENCSHSNIVMRILNTLQFGNRTGGSLQIFPALCQVTLFPVAFVVTWIIRYTFHWKSAAYFELFSGNPSHVAEQHNKWEQGCSCFLPASRPV